MHTASSTSSHVHNVLTYPFHIALTLTQTHTHTHQIQRCYIYRNPRQSVLGWIIVWEIRVNSLGAGVESGFWGFFLQIITLKQLGPLENGSSEFLWGIRSWSGVRRLLGGAGQEVWHGYRVLLFVLLFGLCQGWCNIRWVKRCYPVGENSGAAIQTL